MSAEERRERRNERLARNEALFREVNERVTEVGAGAGLDSLRFICECGDAGCTTTISLIRAEYEHVRADPLLFAIARGHAIPDVEDIVSDNERFQVVRKHEPEARVARATDPRGRHAENS